MLWIKVGVEQTRSTNVVRGASIMVICVALAKVLGVVWIIPVTSLIGKIGLGYYNNAYAVYTILQQLATSGFPLAMGKLISERLARKEYPQVEQIYRVTSRSLMVFGVIAFLLMWFGAPVYSRLVAVSASGADTSLLVPSIHAMSFLLLLIPLLSGLRGYLQGFQQMTPSAYSQTLEQLFRVITMVVGTAIVMHETHNVAYGAAASTFGGVVGAAAGIILLLVAFRPLRREFGQYDTTESPLTNAQTLRMIYKIAIPISLGGLVLPIANLSDSLTVTNLLLAVGESFKQAVGNYGILTRQALYLIQIPLAFAYAIGASVLPAISEAKALRDQQAIQTSVVNTLRSTLFITVPTGIVLVLLARPIDYVLTHGYQGANIITAISFMSLFSSLELISTYMLQGLGKMYRPVRNMFFGIIIKVILNVVLILTMKSVMGAAIATSIGYMVSSSLNVLAVKKYGRVRFSIWKMGVPYAILAIPTVAAMFITRWICEVLSHPLLMHFAWMTNLFVFLVSSLVGGAVYLTVALQLGIIRAGELKNLPGGRRLERLANKLYRD